MRSAVSGQARACASLPTRTLITADREVKTVYGFLKNIARRCCEVALMTSRDHADLCGINTTYLAQATIADEN